VGLEERHELLRDALGREAGPSGERVPEVHEVVGRRVDAAHGLERGRVRDGDEHDEALRRRGVERLREAL
jgi:hypothetical protein